MHSLPSSPSPHITTVLYAYSTWLSPAPALQDRTTARVVFYLYYHSVSPPSQPPHWSAATDHTEIPNRPSTIQRVPCWATGTPPHDRSVARMRRGPGIAVTVAHFTGERAGRQSQGSAAGSIDAQGSIVGRKGRRRSSGSWLLKKTALHAPSLLPLWAQISQGQGLQHYNPFPSLPPIPTHTPANVG